MIIGTTMLTFITTTFLFVASFSFVQADEVMPSNTTYDVVLSSPGTKKDAIASINSALSYIKKALEADNMSDLETYARRAQSAAGDAESYSDDIGNDDAEWLCDKAYNDLRRAQNSNSRKEAVEYLQKAQKALRDALTEL